MNILPEGSASESSEAVAECLSSSETVATAPTPRVYSRVDVSPALLPPSSNTEVTNTAASSNGGPMVSFDWFSFTIPSAACIPFGTILAALTPPGQTSDDWTDAERGGMGYSRIKLRGLVRVYFDGTVGMGVHVSLSGQAVRQLAAEYNIYTENDWKRFLSRWRSMGARFSRIDGALDTFGDDALDIGLVLAAAKARHLVTPFHQVKRVTGQQWELHGESVGADEGQTLYFGSPTSLERVRIYDKRAERFQAGDMEAASKGPWTRVEVTFKKESAEAFLTAFLEGGFPVLPATIKAKLDFKLPSDTDTNKSRWETAPWWDVALGCCGKLRLLVAKAVTKTIDDAKAWVNRQAAPVFATIIDAIAMECKVTGLDPRHQVSRFVNNLIEQGRSRRKGKHKAMLKAYVPKLSFSGGVV